MDYSDPSYTTTAATQTAADPVATMIMGVVYLAIIALMLVAMWKIFVKAGRPGWAALIPIYNAYVMLKIVGRPGWWLLLFIVPFVGFVVSIILAIDTAKVFGRSTVFGVVGLWLFSIVGYAILAFGKDQYHGPAAAGATPSQPAPPVAPAAPPAV
jgi:hypothetical protein